jgi:hypothetical protein
MSRSETVGIIVPIFFVGRPILPSSNKMIKNMVSSANIQEASFLHDYVISFDSLVSLPPFVVFLIFFLYWYFSLCSQ